MQQQQADGSYNEFWPKTDCYTKAQSLNSTTAASMGLGSSSVPSDVIQEIVNYGLVATQGKYVSNFNNLTRGGLYYWDENSQNSPISGSGAAMVIPNSNGRYVFVSDISQRKYERYYINSRWTNWIYINPPFVTGQEYLTSEFRNGVSVIKKLDTDGIMKWRLSTESTWHVEGGVDNNDLVQQGYTKLGQITSSQASFSWTMNFFPSEILFNFVNVSTEEIAYSAKYGNLNILVDDTAVNFCHFYGDRYDQINGITGMVKFFLTKFDWDRQERTLAYYQNCRQTTGSNAADYENQNFSLVKGSTITIKEGDWGKQGTIEVWKK